MVVAALMASGPFLPPFQPLTLFLLIKYKIVTCLRHCVKGPESLVPFHTHYVFLDSLLMFCLVDQAHIG